MTISEQISSMCVLVTSALWNLQGGWDYAAKSQLKMKGKLHNLRLRISGGKR